MGRGFEEQLTAANYYAWHFYHEWMTEFNMRLGVAATAIDGLPWEREHPRFHEFMKKLNMIHNAMIEIATARQKEEIENARRHQA